MEENTLQSFQILKEKYNLEECDFFRHFQLQLYFLKEMNEWIMIKLKEVIQLTVSVYIGGSKSVISKVYQGIKRGNNEEEAI